MRYVSLTLGAPVHYRSHGSPVLPDGTQLYRPVCRAAEVVEIIDDETGYVTLFVKKPHGLFFDQCYCDQGLRGGTWHWPQDCHG